MVFKHNKINYTAYNVHEPYDFLIILKWVHFAQLNSIEKSEIVKYALFRILKISFDQKMYHFKSVSKYSAT